MGAIIKSKVSVSFSYGDGSTHTVECKLFKDGGKWCCMVGDNIQDGVAGFGDTVGRAISDFQHNAGLEN